MTVLTDVVEFAFEATRVDVEAHMVMKKGKRVVESV